MPKASDLAAFALLASAMVLTPGPNMVYIVSRSICQGARAGLISLGGVALGFIVYMLGAALGVTGLLLALPHALEALRLAGAGYLLWLAWRALAPSGRAIFEVRRLSSEPAGRLFAMGFVTSVLNPKIAVMYLSLLPQFVSPERGDVLAQSLVLGATQIAISVAVNAAIALSAGRIAAFLDHRPFWATAQRWTMGLVLGGLALRLAASAG